MKSMYIVMIICALIACNNGKEINDYNFKNKTILPDSNYILILPDLQNYWVDDNVHILVETVDWIKSQVLLNKIKCVLVVGDLTYCNSESEWIKFRNTFKLIDQFVPVIYCAGNHDYGVEGLCDTRSTNYNKYVDYTNTNARVYFKGSFIYGDYVNSYFVLNINMRKYIVLSLEFGPREEIINWADSIIKSNSESDIIMLTHAYLYDDNERFDFSKYGFDQFGTPYKYFFIDEGKVNDGQEIWSKLVYNNNNVKYIFCGHQTQPSFFGCVVDKNCSGNNVYQFLFNTQELSNGGNGWIQLIRINGDSLAVNYFSPYLNLWNQLNDQN